MTTEIKLIGAAAILGLLLSIVALAMHSTTSGQVASSQNLGAAAGSVGGSGGAGTQSPLPGYVYPNPTNLGYARSNVTEVDNMYLEGGWTSSTAIAEVPSIGSCVTTASTTIFAVQNPFSATSTIAFLSLAGIQGATTTDILIATSSTAFVTPGATSTIGANILNLAGVATSTTFYSVAGVTFGPGKGYTNPKGIANSVSQVEVVVGPSEWVLGFSSSTQPINGNGTTTVGLMPSLSSCTYKIQWDL